MSVPTNKTAIHQKTHSPRRVIAESGNARIIQIDSASQLPRGSEANVIVTGSHGGRIVGQAIKSPAFAAFFNDAGIGKENAGVSRLPLLDEMGIAGIAVDYRSAEIGNARDTYESGIVSTANAHALRSGIEPEMPAREAALLLLELSAEKIFKTSWTTDQWIT